MAAALAEIPLCPAPAVGSERSLSQDEVRQLLSLSGVERASVQVTGSERVALLVDHSRSAPGRSSQIGVSGVRQAIFETTAGHKPAVQRLAAASPKTLPAAATAPVRLVERGANVNVVARAAGVRIATSGKALQPGIAGETILVELEGNKEKVQARVVGPQAVEVAVAEKNR